MPEFEQLREAFSASELTMYGLPIDAKDSDDMLEGWAEDHDPPYELLIGLPKAEVDKVNALVLSELKIDGVPATIVTDRAGHVLLARWGVPTVSDLKTFLWKGERLLQNAGGN